MVVLLQVVVGFQIQGTVIALAANLFWGRWLVIGQVVCYLLAVGRSKAAEVALAVRSYLHQVRPPMKRGACLHSCGVVEDVVGNPSGFCWAT